MYFNTRINFSSLSLRIIVSFLEKFLFIIYLISDPYTFVYLDYTIFTWDSLFLFLLPYNDCNGFFITNLYNLNIQLFYYLIIFRFKYYYFKVGVKWSFVCLLKVVHNILHAVIKLESIENETLNRKKYSNYLEQNHHHEINLSKHSMRKNINKWL